MALPSIEDGSRGAGPRFLQYREREGEGIVQAWFYEIEAAAAWTRKG